MKETDSLMARCRNSRPPAPRPSVSDPRPHLLKAVLAFVRAARSTPGVLRIALLGSLATDKPVPKDADVLVTIDAAMDLGPLARLGRRLQGTAQTINLGADIFLARRRGALPGPHLPLPRVLATRGLQGAELRPAQAPQRRSPVVTLSPALISAPPIDLWPRIVARCAVPADTQALLVAKLDHEPRRT